MAVETEQLISVFYFVLSFNISHDGFRPLGKREVGLNWAFRKAFVMAKPNGYVGQGPQTKEILIFHLYPLL